MNCEEILRASKESAREATNLMEKVLLQRQQRQQRQQRAAEDAQGQRAAAQAAFDTSLDDFRTLFIAATNQIAQRGGEPAADQALPQIEEEEKREPELLFAQEPHDEERKEEPTPRPVENAALGEQIVRSGSTIYEQPEKYMQKVFKEQKQRYQELKGRKMSFVAEVSEPSHSSGKASDAKFDLKGSQCSNKAVYQAPQPEVQPVGEEPEQAIELEDERPYAVAEYEEEEKDVPFIGLQAEPAMIEVLEEVKGLVRQVIDTHGECSQEQIAEQDLAGNSPPSNLWESAHDDGNMVEQRDQFQALYCQNISGARDKVFRRT